MPYHVTLKLVSQEKTNYTKAYPSLSRNATVPFHDVDRPIGILGWLGIKSKGMVLPPILKEHRGRKQYARRKGGTDEKEENKGKARVK